MESNSERVRQFHHAVGAHDPAIPTRPDTSRLSLRRTLIEEEGQEVLEAFTRLEAAHKEDSEVAFHALVHELTDLLYVTYGALIAFGVDPDSVFSEIHRANMEKVTGPRRKDGKQLKPEGWRPADISSVLAAQEHERPKR